MRVEGDKNTMRGVKAEGLVGLLAAAFAVGCGGESGSNQADSSSTTTGATTASTAGDGSDTTASNTAQTASVGTGGAGSTTANTTAATSGGPSSDCSGAFGEPTLLFTAEVTAPQSFSLTPDELELYYINYPEDVRFIERRVRSSRSSSFGPGEAVPELLDVCPSVNAVFGVGTVDLSPDGLTAYISCEENVDLPTTLVSATRPALGAPFTPDLASIGTVGASFATADGLEGFSNTPGALDQLDRHRRTSLTAPFGQAERLPIALRGPDPSNDGLWLFGSVPVEGSETQDYHLGSAARADLTSAFGEPTIEGLPAPPAGFSDLTPTISADCRSLYFLRFGASGVFSVMVAQR